MVKFCIGDSSIEYLDVFAVRKYIQVSRAFVCQDRWRAEGGGGSSFISLRAHTTVWLLADSQARRCSRMALVDLQKSRVRTSSGRTLVSVEW